MVVLYHLAVYGRKLIGDFRSDLVIRESIVKSTRDCADAGLGRA